MSTINLVPTWSVPPLSIFFVVVVRISVGVVTDRLPHIICFQGIRNAHAFLPAFADVPAAHLGRRLHSDVFGHD